MSSGLCLRSGAPIASLRAMLRQVQTLAGAVMGSVVIAAIVLGVAFPEGERFDAPPLWLVAAQVAAAVVVHLLVEAIGYRTAALHLETSEAEARTMAARAFTSGTVVRLGLCESIALGSVAAAFLVDSGGYVGILTGAAISLALMAVHAWPGDGPIEKTRTSLERDGGRSYLREQPADGEQAGLGVGVHAGARAAGGRGRSALALQPGPGVGDGLGHRTRPARRRTPPRRRSRAAPRARRSAAARSAARSRARPRRPRSSRG